MLRKVTTGLAFFWKYSFFINNKWINITLSIRIVLDTYIWFSNYFLFRSSEPPSLEDIDNPFRDQLVLDDDIQVGQHYPCINFTALFLGMLCWFNDVVWVGNVRMIYSDCTLWTVLSARLQRPAVLADLQQRGWTFMYSLTKLRSEPSVFHSPIFRNYWETVVNFQ